MDIDYSVSRLEIIAYSFGFACLSKKDMSEDEVLEETLGIFRDSCYRIMKGESEIGFSPEDTDGYLDLLGVLQDIENEKVVPSIGNVRDYVFAISEDIRNAKVDS